VPGLLLPRAYVAAELNAMVDAKVDDQIAEGEHWNHELKRIDQDLSLVWVPEGVEQPGVIAGRFHIRKRVPGGLDGYIPLIGPNGEFRPPGPWMLDALAEADMWNERVRGERARNADRLREARRRQRVREEEQMQDEMRLAARAAGRMRGDGGLHKRTDLKRPGAKKVILP
jgi:hypothetical protein